MMSAFLLSTAVIFVAELGDKSQLMALTFAARYRARDVLLGITAATAVVHLASVGIGAVSYTHLDVYKRQAQHRSRRAVGDRHRPAHRGDAVARLVLHAAHPGGCLLYTSRCV